MMGAAETAFKYQALPNMSFTSGSRQRGATAGSDRTSDRTGKRVSWLSSGQLNTARTDCKYKSMSFWGLGGPGCPGNPAKWWGGGPNPNGPFAKSRILVQRCTCGCTREGDGRGGQIKTECLLKALAATGGRGTLQKGLFVLVCPHLRRSC